MRNYNCAKEENSKKKKFILDFSIQNVGHSFNGSKE